MARHTPTAFERVFPNREFLTGATRSSVLWSALASLILVLFLFTLYLIADLLDTGGVLHAPAEAVPAIARLANQDPEQTRVGSTAPEVSYEDRGLLPAVWWGRHKIWGPALATLHRRLIPLRQNSLAFALLSLCAACLWLARIMAQIRARAQRLRAALEVSSRMRTAIHRQALRLGPGDLSGAGEQQVLQLFTEDTDRLGIAIFHWIDGLGRSVFEILCLIALALAVHAPLTVLCAVPLGVCWYVAERQRHRLRSLRDVSAARSETELRLLAESLRKTRLVRGYGMEDFAREQFEKHLQRFHQSATAAVRDEGWSGWVSRVLVIFWLAFVLYMIGIKVLLEPHELSFAAALLFMGTLAWISVPLQMLWRLKREREDASQSANRIQRYLNQIPEVSQAVGAKFLQPLSRLLEFENVTYLTSDQRKLLDGFSLKLASGLQVALISTDPHEALALASMLPRFIEPQSGRILIDGEDIAWVTLESLRAEIAYVGGDDPFFTGTVLENISGGKSGSVLSDVTEAAKLTHAHNFILKLPQGYETVIGEHGEQLDVGQSFRLGLARAILRKPALLIVEEPIQPLTEDTKSLIDDAYNRIQRDRTVLYLPARMSTLRRVDQIVLIHQGRVEAVGTHDELVRTSPLYQHWEYVRFNEFRRFENGG